VLGIIIDAVPSKLKECFNSLCHYFLP